MTPESTFEYKEERPSPREKEFEESAANRGCCEFCFFLIQFNKAQAKRLEHQRQYQLNNNKGRRQQKSPSVRDKKNTTERPSTVLVISVRGEHR